MVDLDTKVLVAILSCPLNRVPMLVLDVIACHVSYLSYLRVVLRDLPDWGGPGLFPLPAISPAVCR